ncbi:MAG: prepilin peptidase [Patescibacteria group bacterium]
MFILGLLVGSFLNVLIYRLPRELPFVKGRSHCPHCDRVLAWYDLVPVVSYVMLRGRCRQCHHHISLQYPLVELLSGVLFVFAPSLLWLVALEVFLVLAVIDLQHLLIPDALLVVLIAVALAMRVAWQPWNLLSALAVGGLLFLLWFLSKGTWIGFGDVKLVAVLGLLFGFPGTAIVIYGGVMIGGLVSVVLLALRKANRKTAVPLGTFLALAAIVYILYEPAQRLFPY